MFQNMNMNKDICLENMHDSINEVWLYSYIHSCVLLACPWTPCGAASGIHYFFTAPTICNSAIADTQPRSAWSLLYIAWWWSGVSLLHLTVISPFPFIRNLQLFGFPWLRCDSKFELMHTRRTFDALVHSKCRKWGRKFLRRSTDRGCTAVCTRRRFQPDTSLRCQWLRKSWFRGLVRLGMAFDLNLMQAQTMMLRWNGSRLNANNLIETLPSNLAGGQSVRSHAATELLPFQSHNMCWYSWQSFFITIRILRITINNQNPSLHDAFGPCAHVPAEPEIVLGQGETKHDYCWQSICKIQTTKRPWMSVQAAQAEHVTIHGLCR